MIVKAGKQKRHHFAHKSGGQAHSPESVMHHAGKDMMLQWLKATYPDWTIELEATLGLDSGKTRRADILATSPVAPYQRLAFEIQYSALSAEDWLLRHNDYKSLGIEDIWLWGNAGANFRPDPNFQSDTGAGLLSSAVLDLCNNETGSLLFIDPDEGLIMQGFTAGYLRKVKELYQLQLLESSAGEGALSIFWPPPLQCSEEYYLGPASPHGGPVVLSVFNLEQCGWFEGAFSAKTLAPFLRQISQLKGAFEEMESLEPAGSGHIYSAQEVREMERELLRLGALFNATANQRHCQAYKELHSTWLQAKPQQ